LPFEPIARAWHANREEGLDPAHADHVLRRMERDVFPPIGKHPITDITAPEVLEVVRTVEARAALDIGGRLKQNIGQVIRFAIASGCPAAMRRSLPRRRCAVLKFSAAPALLSDEGRGYPIRAGSLFKALAFPT